MISGAAWLFCPADRPERYAKAAARADVVILDLEDGVAPADRPAAASRSGLVGSRSGQDGGADQPGGYCDHSLDLIALAGFPTTTSCWPRPIRRRSLSARSPAGDRSVRDRARHPARLVDRGLTPGRRADVGGRGPGGQPGRFVQPMAGWAYRDVARHARSTVLLAAGGAGVGVLDSVYLDIADLDGLEVEAVDAVASGFTAKACIHPSQVEVVRRAFRPSDRRGGRGSSAACRSGG